MYGGSWDDPQVGRFDNVNDFTILRFEEQDAIG